MAHQSTQSSAPNKNNILEELKKAYHVALLKEDVMEKIAKDKDKTSYAIGIIAIGIVLGAIGRSSGYFSSGFHLNIALYQIIQTVAGIFLAGFIAVKLFKAQANYEAFLRLMGYGLIVSWLSFISFLAPIAGIWGLVIAFVGMKKIFHLNPGAIVGTLILTGVVLGVLSGLIMPDMMENYYRPRW